MSRQTVHSGEVLNIQEFPAWLYIYLRYDTDRDQHIMAYLKVRTFSVFICQQRGSITPIARHGYVGLSLWFHAYTTTL